MSVGDSKTIADGSALADSHEPVEIDRSGASKYRYRCPRGHVNWDRTNNHIWCPQCRRQAEAGEDVNPEHFEIVDEKTGETIPWSAIEVVE